MKALEDLFFGYNIPFEAPSLDPDEYHRLNEKIQESENPLWKSMNPEQKKLYNQYIDSCTELTSMQERDAFIRGFRLAVQFFLESLTQELYFSGKSHISANSES
ncbi:MAG: hypothetical protein E7579_09580 [Ruminococcaceae bacterium]|nr:hypothetical protein [Oscillospiraceae bacterium]